MLRLDRLPMPLQKPLRVRERPVLLRVRGGGEEEHLRRDLRRLQLPGFDLRRVVPERRRLDLRQVAHDEPVELRECKAVELRVRRADGRVLAEDDVALRLAVEHVEHRAVRRMVARDPRQVVEEVVVVLRRVLAVIRLQQRHEVRLHVAPEARRRGVALDELVEIVIVACLMRLRVGHRDVAGEDVVQRRDVRRALDRGVPAERHDPAARPPDVPEQELDDRRGADVLHADRVLRPADGVDERARALAAGVVAQRFRDLEEVLLRTAAQLGDELGRVARVVALHDLEDAARVLQREVLFRRLGVLEVTAVRTV